MATGLKAFVTVFLFREDRVLLLRRADDRPFAPGLWTGVGGWVEPEEAGDLAAAALREVREEAGLQADQVRGLTIRAVLAQPEGGDVVVVAFFTGRTDAARVGPCDEGELHWVAVNRVDELDLIENARQALEVAIRAEAGEVSGVRFGVCEPAGGGSLRTLTWAPEGYRPL